MTELKKFGAVPFLEFDWAQVVNAMMRAKDKTKFWRAMLRGWANNASWLTKEADVKLIVEGAWQHGKAETANIKAHRQGKTVVLNVYVRFTTGEVEESFVILMEEAT